MQFESLQVFCDVARHRSISQAAGAHGLTQSRASQIVQELEERLGVQLIDRSTRPLQLTDAGQSYYDGVKELVEQYLELEASVRAAGARAEAMVQVAAIYSVGLGDMGQYVERFRAVRPEARVSIEYLHPDRVYEKVLDGTADLGLVSFPKKARDLDVLPWRDEEMVLACPPGHPLAARRSVTPRELDGATFVGFEKGLTIRKEVDRFLREHDAAVAVGPEFDNIENIKQAVEVGAGVALLPAPTLRREVAAGTLAAVPLTGARLVRPLGIIFRHGRPGTTAMRFVELLRSAEDGTDATTKRRGARWRPGSNGANGRRNGAARGSKKDGVR